jgi:hypothetical protein
LPAAVVRRVGKGAAVHICTDIFARYGQLGDPQMLRWLREIVDFLQPKPLLHTDAPSVVVHALHLPLRAGLHLNGHDVRDGIPAKANSSSDPAPTT